MIQFLAKSFTNQVARLCQIFYSLVEQFEKMITKKLELANGGTSKVEEFQATLRELQSTEHLEKINADAKALRKANIEQLYSAISPKLKEKIPELVRLGKAPGPGFLSDRLDTQIESYLLDAIRKFEASTHTFATAKQTLVQELTEYTKAFSLQMDNLYEDTASVIQAPSSLESEKAQFFIAPGIAFPVALPRTLIEVSKLIQRAFSKLSQMLDSAESYVEKKLEQLLQPDSLEERVKQLFFSPDFLIQTVRYAIKEIIDHQKGLLEGAEQEKRDYATMKAALDPHYKALEALKLDVKAFLDDWKKDS